MEESTEIHSEKVWVSYMGHSTELVQTAVPQSKSTFNTHLNIQILNVS